MEQLIKQIEQWASDRNIIKGSKPIDQAMKLFSEFGELADNVGKGRDCRDDIGDVFVVLTIMCKQKNSTLSLNIAELENLSLKQYVIELGLALNQFSYNCDTGGSFEDDLLVIVSSLSKIASLHNYTLEECVQIAYDDIKHRKGIMTNGVFIKESDPVYAQVISEIEGNYNA